MKNQMKNQNGFTILYALLISSLLLSIGLGIYDLSLRGFSLAAAASESQKAIFAADTGLECALYWDLKANNGDGVFSNFAPRGVIAAPCGLDANIIPSVNTANDYSSFQGISANHPFLEYLTQFTFYISANSLTASCASVQVSKNLTASTTTIDSRGYNTCDTADPRRVERGLHTTY